MKERIILAILLLTLALGSCVSFSSCTSSDQKEELAVVLSEKLEGTNYTADSYAAYEEAWTHAQTVYENGNASALEIDRAIENLNSAKSSLVKKADFSQLKIAIDDSVTVEQELYTEVSYYIFAAALQNALDVYEKDTSKQSEINSAITSLKNAKEGLVKIPSTNALIQLLQERIEMGEYTTKSYAVYIQAYENASVLVESGTTSQSDLLLAENLLRQAISALVKKADITPLKKQLEDVEKSYLGVDDKNREPADRYSKQSYALFCAVVERVRQTVDGADASEEDVVSLQAELSSACAALVDMSELLDKIDLLGNYSEQSYYYTPESYDGLLAAISAGISVAKSESPTAEQLSVAADEIDRAISSLVRRALTADGKKDKQLLYRVIIVGNSRILLGTYLDDYVSFFETVDNENVNLSYRFVGEDGVEFSSEKTTILMKDGYMKISYAGSVPVSQTDVELASIGGIYLAHTEFDIAAETNFGAPSEYTKRTDVVMGQENTIAVLTYENETDGVKVVFEYNTIGNYISSMEIIRTTV